MIPKIFISIALSLILVLSPSQHADSLWKSGKGSLYGVAKKEIQVGDLITVLISESTSAAQQANTKTSKESDINTNLLSGWNQVANLLGNEINRKTYDFTLKGGDDFKGSGQTSRQSRVTSIVTAVVTEILDNGSVYIVGEHKVKVNNEVETIHVSGIVRPADIGANNTVNSSQIGKIEVAVNGVGVVGAKQSPGIITKLFNWLF